MVVRASPDEPWRVIGQSEGEEAHVEVTLDSADLTTTGEKRARSPSHEDGPQTKRVRASPSEDVKVKKDETPETSPNPTSRCLAPALNKAAQRVLSANGIHTDIPELVGAGDVFLTQGFRDRWCRCSTVWVLVFILLVHPDH
jgi:E3 ubiquitin-protein ligase UBR7